MVNDAIFKMFEGIKPGEIVLLEYLPSHIPEFFVKEVVEYAKAKGLPLIIDDNFDTLPVIVNNMDTLDISIDINNVPVIKTGGRIDVGNVIAKVKFHPDPRVYLMNYINAAKGAFDEYPNAMNMVLGLESLFHLPMSVPEFYTIILNLEKFLGNEKRRAFYLMNKEVLNALPFYTAAEMRRIASTVVELKPYPTGARALFVKSPNIGILGREVIVDVGEEL
nr:DUF257 family protein [Thermococcus sp. Bubb.Bath]